MKPIRGKQAERLEEKKIWEVRGLDLIQAVRASMENGVLFYRKSWPWEAKLKVVGQRRTIHAVWPDGRDVRGWQPDAEDFLAEDWEVTQE